MIDATREHLTEAARARLDREDLEMAATAKRLGVEAVGREEPTHTTKRGGFRLTKAGHWFVVVGGERGGATAAQARALNATYAAHGVGGPYRSVGPIAAA